MQISMNKARTAITLRVYTAYDQGKRRAITKYIGSIRVFPEVPAEIPESILRSIPQKHRDRDIQQLQRKLAEARATIKQALPVAAVAALNAVADAVDEGLVIEASEMAALANAWGRLEVAEEPTRDRVCPPSSAATDVQHLLDSPSVDPAIVAVNAVNALLDAVQKGFRLNEEAALDLKVGLELIDELTVDTAGSLPVPAAHNGAAWTDTEAAVAETSTQEC